MLLLLSDHSFVDRESNEGALGNWVSSPSNSGPVADGVMIRCLDLARRPPMSIDHDPKEHCPRCRAELVQIQLLVDGNNLLMRSCSQCDTRSWSLSGETVDLKRALTEVGVRSGRGR